jgi:uncharacterized protein involved in exopolysaccharide biosynthesis
MTAQFMIVAVSGLAGIALGVSAIYVWHWVDDRL